MAFQRCSARSVIVATACGAVIILTGGDPAIADGPDSTYSAEATVLAAPQTDISTALSRQDPSVVVRATGTSHQALGFSLEPDTTWVVDETLRPLPHGLSRQALTAAQWGSVTWLAAEYYNIGDRIPTEETEGQVDYETDMAAERAAYQLAIWSFSADTDLALLPDGAVSRRARHLADLAEAEGGSLTGANGPLAQVRLDLTKTAQYVRGERLIAHLAEVDPGESDVAGALVEFSSAATGQPIRVLQTDSRGNATLDLPNNEEFLGDVRAEWRTRIPPGTVMSGSAGELVLYRSLPVTITSPAVTHSAPNGFGEWLGRAATMIVHRIQAFPAVPEMALLVVTFALVLLSSLGALSLFVERLKWQHIKPLGALALVALCLGAWYLGAAQSGRYRTQWASESVAPGTDGESVEAEILSVRQTSEYRGTYPDYFSGWCAVDRDDAGRPVFSSAWLSFRGLGTGEFLVLELASPMLVTSVDLVPGWFGTRSNYDSTGRPQRVLVFTDSGHAAVGSMDGDVPYESGPQASTLDLGDAPLPATTHVFVQVTRIQGDARTYAGISDLAVHGVPVAEPPRDHGVISVEDLDPSVEEAAPCGASPSA
jgi:hypothetical protein